MNRTQEFERIDEENALLGTITFPKSFKNITGLLPEANYHGDSIESPSYEPSLHLPNLSNNRSRSESTDEETIKPRPRRIKKQVSNRDLSEPR